MANDDYYQVLGVARDSEQAEIQKAYRQLARKYHPDLNPDDKQAKQKFQEVQNAFEVLNDPKKRELYDRYGASYEQMAAGAGAPGGGPGGGPGGATYTWTSGGPGGFEDFDFAEIFGGGGGAGAAGGGQGFEDIFSHFRGGGGARHRPPMRRRGADLEHEITVPFNTAVLGGEAQLSVRRGSGKVETISVKIPAGIEPGKRIRLRGQGEEGSGGGSAGDLLLAVNVSDHPHFDRRGKNLMVKLPLTIGEAAAGAKVDVPTPHGTVTLSIPPGTSGGAKLRVKGHGVRPRNQEPGDLLVEVQIVLPKPLDEESRKWFQKFDEQHPLQPRAELRW